MQEYNLEFCFKGSRTYVQGPDIFDAVIEKLEKDYSLAQMKDVKYAAHDMLLANADLIIVEEFNKNDYEQINSVITFKIDNKKYYAVVIENINKIECANEYSEEIVRTKSIINGPKIIFENILDDSLTELTVSMNKYFLQQTVPENGKWIVTKFEYTNLIDTMNIANKKLSLEITNNFNNKLTKSIIRVDSQIVGYLYFSLI